MYFQNYEELWIPTYNILQGAHKSSDKKNYWWTIYIITGYNTHLLFTNNTTLYNTTKHLFTQFTVYIADASCQSAKQFLSIIRQSATPQFLHLHAVFFFNFFTEDKRVVKFDLKQVL